MSRADDLAAKAARLRAGKTAAQETPTNPEISTSVSTDLSTSVPAEPVPAATPASSSPVVRGAVRSKPVRLTVDVAPTEHAQLAQLSLEAASTLGAARVAGQELVRALLRRYLADQELQRQVLADVAEHRRVNRLR